MQQYAPTEAAQATGLFPSAATRRAVDDRLTEALALADARAAQGSVTPSFDRAGFNQVLAAFDFATPRPLEDVLPWVIARLEDGITHLTHPRYFGLFNQQPSFPAQVADRLTAVFNPQLATATTSPVPVAMEAHVIRAVAARAGLPDDASGHFTTGGAEANATALLCALTRACPDFAEYGARAFPGAPVLYVSKDSHLAWLKIAHQCGIGRARVRLVGTDGMGRMDASILEAALAADSAEGRIPVMVAATAGTTNAGMIDPLEACAEIARTHGAWFHVDAAWGGAVIASPFRRRLLKGIEHADSVTIDAHKWFATTMGCGMFLIADPALLPAVFQVSTTYMPSNQANLDPYVNSMQWSRRFLGLRLFLALATAGWDGYAAHVERSISLIARLRTALHAHGWKIVNDSQMAVLCAVPPSGGSTAREIVTRVVTSGEAWISVAVFEGQEVVRACVTHGQTDEDDIETLVEALTAPG